MMSENKPEHSDTPDAGAVADMAIAVVQKQLDAYNAKDLDALLDTYAPDAEQYTLHGPLLVKGREAMRARFAARLAEPALHARLLSRMVMGNFVTDLERVTRNFPEGPGTVEMLCVYEVVDGYIQRASFAAGQPALGG
ncbi:nuclear transport factor 2 family protein [Bordetella sp. LUAb4]|uniref:nuclear transport factor 2 family protein n=1 Tax=Bordetella sp. LUAb4 TaxID=2843195 RepID=UPI001E408047|nr:nuclear transport factor 2 family protein [Bordetella sp. LUAb4]